MAKMEKHKRNLWRDLEVETLVSIIKEKHILQLLDGKQRRNKAIYESIEKDMKAKGFMRNSDQIRIKFKALKAEYNKVKRHNNTSGAQRITCPYYDILNEILHDRPVVQTEGIDTSINDSLQELEKGNYFDQLLLFYILHYFSLNLDVNEDVDFIDEISEQKNEDQDHQENQNEQEDIHKNQQQSKSNNLKVFNNPSKILIHIYLYFYSYKTCTIYHQYFCREKKL